MNQVVPEVQVIYAPVAGIERREIGHTLVRSACKVHGILASQTVLGHEPHGDPTHEGCDRYLDPRKAAQNSVKLAEQPVNICSTNGRLLPAPNSVLTLKIVGQFVTEARPRDDVCQLKP